MNCPLPEFWLVWHEGGNAPTFKHQTLHSAHSEAERLARQAPGKTFCVLHCIASCVKSDIQWSERRPVDECDIPF